jgi:hypothetical protein
VEKNGSVPMSTTTSDRQYASLGKNSRTASARASGEDCRADDTSRPRMYAVWSRRPLAPAASAALLLAAAAPPPLPAACAWLPPAMSGVSLPDSPSKSRKFTARPSASAADAYRFTLNVVDAVWSRPRCTCGRSSPSAMSPAMVVDLPTDVSPRNDTTITGAQGSTCALNRL